MSQMKITLYQNYESVLRTDSDSFYR